MAERVRPGMCLWERNHFDGGRWLRDLGHVKGITGCKWEFGLVRPSPGSLWL